MKIATLLSTFKSFEQSFFFCHQVAFIHTQSSGSELVPSLYFILQF